MSESFYVKAETKPANPYLIAPCDTCEHNTNNPESEEPCCNCNMEKPEENN